MDHYRRDVVPEFYCKPIASSKNKELRATPLSSAVEAGNVRLVAGQWNVPFIDEAALFPHQGQHDDQVDAVAGAHGILARSSVSRIIA
jgi:predicted phage terminase large subunit-like protein